MNASQLPRYKVGETVIVVSSKYPHFNGEYRVRAILRHGDKYLDRITKIPTTIKLTNAPHCYQLHDVLMNNSGQEFIITEQLLRKKHQPATMSFREIMARA